jgi:protoheme IX farnesyltransferase
MLTKPGIIFGNIVTTIGGFALASQGHFDWYLLAATLAGLGLVIASAGIFNNYIDRVADAKMERTKDRGFVQGTVSTTIALQLAVAFLITGIGTLALYTNLLTVFVTLIGFFVYLVLYAFMKYHSFYGTLVGSIAGAVPPVVGYCAVSNNFDLGAALIFSILVLWQMPHFFAIAIYRHDDYAAADIPVMPVAKGMDTTKKQMCFYILAFLVAALALSQIGLTGSLYTIIVLLLSIAWFGLCLRGLYIAPEKNRTWAKEMFVYSLVVIMGLCLVIPLDLYFFTASLSQG